MGLMGIMVIGLALLIVVGGVVLLVVTLVRSSTRPAPPPQMSRPQMAPPQTAPPQMVPPQMAPPANGPAPDQQWAQLEQGARAIVASHGKIAAVKWVREQTGLGLAEAKDFVDRLA